MKMTCVAIAITTLAVLPLFVHADDTDITLHQSTNSYTITLRYPTSFQAGIPNWITLFLTQTQDQRPLPFKTVHATISRDGVPYLDIWIAKKVGVATGGVTTLPQPGNYLVHTIFYDTNDTSVGEASFTIPVSAPTNQKRILGIPLTREMGVGALGGVMISALFVQYERIMRRHDPDVQP